MEPRCRLPQLAAAALPLPLCCLASASRLPLSRISSAARSASRPPNKARSLVALLSLSPSPYDTGTQHGMPQPSTSSGLVQSTEAEILHHPRSPSTAPSEAGYQVAPYGHTHACRRRLAAGPGLGARVGRPARRGCMIRSGHCDGRARGVLSARTEYPGYWA